MDKVIPGILDSRTVMGSVFMALIWAVAAHFGVAVPVEALMVAIGAVGLKETARRARGDK